MERELKHKSEGYVVELCNSEVHATSGKEVPTFLNNLIQHFHKIFKEPAGMPLEETLSMQSLSKKVLLLLMSDLITTPIIKKKK